MAPVDDGFIVPEWMGWDDDMHIVLRGQRCSSCGTFAWPPAASCKACSGVGLEAAVFGPEAEMYSVTIDRMGTFLGYPHLVGQVHFAEGPFVQGFVQGEIDDPPKIGEKVVLVPFEVESGGERLLTYAFAKKEG